MSIMLDNIHYIKKQDPNFLTPIFWISPKMAKRLSIIIVCFLSIACLFDVDGENINKTNRKIIVDITANGKRIELKVGDEIQIELKSYGSTGYSWYFDQLDQDFFELISEYTETIHKEREEIAGSPVMMIWKLKTKRSGTSPIRVSYYRAWEGRNKAIDQFEIEVKINQ